MDDVEDGGADDGAGVMSGSNGAAGEPDSAEPGPSSSLASVNSAGSQQQLPGAAQSAVSSQQSAQGHGAALTHTGHSQHQPAVTRALQE